MITSPGNARIKSVMRLMQKTKARREERAFVAEGVKMFLEAPATRIREVYVSESFSCGDQEKERAVKRKLEQVPYETVSAEAFSKLSDTCSPQGILCVIKRYEHRLEKLLQKEDPFLLLLEDIQDPGNLGTMLRSGEGAGIDGVILSGGCVDIYNPKVVRSTMGSIYRVPFLEAVELAQAADQLRQRGVKIYAAHLQGDRSYDQADYRAGTAFLIGNEAKGLKKETAALADGRITIPMAGAVESLNAGAAAAVLLFEAARQRRNGGERR